MLQQYEITDSWLERHTSEGFVKALEAMVVFHLDSSTTMSFQTDGEMDFGQLIFFIYINLYIYIYFWLRWVFVVASGGYSSLRCVGFSLQWLVLLWSTGSRCAGFSSCGTWAQ